MKETESLLRVLIADDSAVVRERIGTLLQEISGVSVVGETEDVAGTLNGIRRLCPRVVILDINMPGGSGLDVLRQMRSEHLQAEVVVLTNLTFPEYEQKARAYGATAFLDKSFQFMKALDLVRDYLPRADSNLSEEQAKPVNASTC